MLDLKGQYRKIQSEIDTALFDAVHSANFINGKDVSIFQENSEN